MLKNRLVRGSKTVKNRSNTGNIGMGIQGLGDAENTENTGDLGYGQGIYGQSVDGQSINGATGRRTNNNKPKKKHGFLKFLLLCLLVYGSYKLSYTILSQMAETEMDTFVSDYPFEFVNDTDSLWYVTGDIIVPNTYNHDDKVYSVKWTTKNNAISISDVSEGSSRISIKRPANNQVRVYITETYNKLWGKAERVYELSLIPTSGISEVNVIDMNNYNRDMQAVYDNNDNLKYMMGDFKNVYINSAIDAETVLGAYKNQFITNEELLENTDFELDDIVRIGIYTTYKFNIKINNVIIEGASAVITANSTDNKLTKVSINIDNGINADNISSVKTENDIRENMKSYIEQITASEGETETGTEKNVDYMVCALYKEYSDNQLVYVVHVVLENGGSYEMKISADTGDMLGYETMMSNSEWDDRVFTDITAKAKNEAGNAIEFNATKIDKNYIIFDTTQYIMHDRTRNVHAYENEGWWGLYKESYNRTGKDEQSFGDTLVMIGGLIDYAIETQLRFEIKSKTDTFDDSEAAQAYANMQEVYDWYKNTFGLLSFDGKGKEVVVRVRTKNRNDNACWDGASKTFVVNPSKNLKYSVGMYLEVLGHEYTHAVFDYAGAGLSDGIEVSGLNEAYADIMGVLIRGTNDWTVCKNYTTDGSSATFRDLKNINTEELYRGEKYPDVYYGENWTGEEHNICPIIGHVAWDMYANGGFSYSDIARIWYNSLGLCYDNSSTFVTCRKYIIQTAEDLVYSDDKIDFIAKSFDDREIFDPTYEFKTTGLKGDGSDKSSNGFRTKRIKSQAVKGDDLLDDSNQHRFLVAYSPIGSAIGKSGIVIYEETDGRKQSSSEQKSIGKKIEGSIKDAMDKTVIEDMSVIFQEIGISDGADLTVTYKQVNKIEMDMIEKIFGGQIDEINGIKNYTYSHISESLTDEEFDDMKSMLEQPYSLILQVHITRSTRYDLYDSLGILD